MAQKPELIPTAVRVALRNAVGGEGPYTVSGIWDLFEMHEFTDRDPDVPDAGGQRRTAAEQFHARIDWTSRDQAQRYLDLVSDALDHYPVENDQPGTPGRVLRRALDHGGFVAHDGRLVLPGHPESVEPDVAGIWIPHRPRIFMSHVNTAKDVVGAVASSLESLHTSCFVAHTQIEPSRDWQDTIEVALQTCHVLVAWVTNDFPQSRWCDQEVGWVLGRGIPVIPVNAGLQPYGFFGARQSLPAKPWPYMTALDIFPAFAAPALRAQPPPGAVPADMCARAIVSAFADSPSFDGTRARYPLLELIPPALWTDDMMQELDASTVLNDQISEANLNSPRMSAPEAVDQLLRRVARQRTP